MAQMVVIMRLKLVHSDGAELQALPVHFSVVDPYENPWKNLELWEP